jgi:hypothetical protein
VPCDQSKNALKKGIGAAGVRNIRIMCAMGVPVGRLARDKKGDLQSRVHTPRSVLFESVCVECAALNNFCLCVRKRQKQLSRSPGPLLPATTPACVLYQVRVSVISYVQTQTLLHFIKRRDIITGCLRGSS